MYGWQLLRYTKDKLNQIGCDISQGYYKEVKNKISIRDDRVNALPLRSPSRRGSCVSTKVVIIRHTDGQSEVELLHLVTFIFKQD